MPTYRDIDNPVRINGSLDIIEEATVHQSLHVEGVISAGVGTGSISDIASAINSKLPLAGGTLTGDLNINKSAPKILIRPSSSNQANGGEIFFYGTTNGSNGFKIIQNASSNTLRIVGRASGTDSDVLTIARDSGNMWVKGDITLGSGKSVDGVVISSFKQSFDDHEGDQTIHLSSSQKSTLTGGTSSDASSLHIHNDIYYTKSEMTSFLDNKSDISHRHNNATGSQDGFMSSADKTKLNGIATNAEVNQNAYSEIKIGSTSIPSTSKTDIFTIEGSTNITVTPNVSGKSATISATGLALSGHNHNGTYVRVNGSDTMTGSLKISRSGASGTVEIDHTSEGLELKSTQNGISLKPNNGIVNIEGDIVLPEGKSIQETGRFNRVHSVCIYGNGGDLQFETQSTSWQEVTSFNKLFNPLWSMPPVPTGATRHYEVYIIYGDDIQPTDQDASGRLRISTKEEQSSIIQEFSLPRKGTHPNDRVGLFLGKFTTSYEDDVSFEARIQNNTTNFSNTNGRAFAIERIEVIAYDVY